MPQLPLVDYSSSSSSSPSPPPSPPQKKHQLHPPTSTLPPLPSRFHNLYAVPPRLADDPALHAGRQRAVPHTPGCWPTHVFLEWHLTPAEFDALNQLLLRARETIAKIDADLKLESHLVSELGAQQPLHLSLSAPCSLKTEQKEGFLETVRERVGRARVGGLDVRFSGCEWVGNWKKNRWFWVLKATVKKGSQLPRLLEVVNRTAKEFGQPTLYQREEGEDAVGFHVSIGWSLREPGEEVKKALAEALERTGEELKMCLDTLKVKMGSNFFDVALGPEGMGAKEEGRKRRLTG